MSSRRSSGGGGSLLEKKQQKIMRGLESSPVARRDFGQMDKVERAQARKEAEEAEARHAKEQALKYWAKLRLFTRKMIFVSRMRTKAQKDQDREAVKVMQMKQYWEEITNAEEAARLQREADHRRWEKANQFKTPEYLQHVMEQGLASIMGAMQEVKADPEKLPLLLTEVGGSMRELSVSVMNAMQEIQRVEKVQRDRVSAEAESALARKHGQELAARGFSSTAKDPDAEKKDMESYEVFLREEELRREEQEFFMHGPAHVRSVDHAREGRADSDELV
ncbi:unnamed protein product, partial [Amoebophrya sp. A25]|eukprot:GSA25T00000849001.1